MRNLQVVVFLLLLLALETWAFFGAGLPCTKPAGNADGLHSSNCFTGSHVWLFSRSSKLRKENSLNLKSTADTVVLDFGGVVCDSFPEWSRVAYRAAMRKWPDTMRNAKDVTPREAGVRSAWVGYEWSSYEKDSEGDVPQWLYHKLRQVRDDG